MIQVKNISKSFQEKMVLQNLNFEIKNGEIVALVGANGAGKTTLISMMEGILTPDKGSITIEGEKAGEKKLHEKVSGMLQDSFAIPRLKVKEVFALFQSYYQQPISAAYFYQLTGLEGQANTFSEKLSGGQRRRLSFGLAMVGNPDLIFLDEPTTGMDIMSREAFWKQIKNLKQAGKTVIVTTHYLEEVEKVADRVLILQEGQMTHDGTMTSLREKMAFTQVTFQCRQPQKYAFHELAGVIEVLFTGEKVTLQTNNSDETVIDLVTSQVNFSELAVLPTSLEMIFKDLVENERGN